MIATPWWALDDERQRASDVVSAAKALRDRQTSRRAWLTLAHGLYDDSDASDLTPTGYTVERSTSDVQTVLNVVRACSDTVRAELIQTKPRPMFLPAGADWSVRRKCQQMSRFLEGLFTEQAFDRTASSVAMDAILFGTGVLRVFVEGGKPQLERVMPWEVWVDERDGYYGKPRTIYLLRYVNRDTLLELYPEARDAIERTGGDERRWVGSSPVDQVAVVEAFHLPTTPESEDGRHTIAIDQGVLLDEAWTHDWFPLVFMHWKAPRCGFWATGLAAELYEIQCDLNRVVEAVQVGQRLNTWPRLAVPRAAQVNLEAITDEPGTMVEFSGPTPPTALIWPGCPPEIYQWVSSQIEWAFRFSGVSMAAASSQKSPGLTSGRAIQMESNLQSRRFLDVQRAFEQLYLDAARVVVGMMEHEAENDVDAEVVWRGKYRAERIKWRQARLDESGYVIRLTPVSALPQSPAGRVDQIAGLMNSGFAQQAGAPLPLLIRALDTPDSESLLGPISCAYDLVEKICEDMLDDGEKAYRRPEPFFNLSVCLLVGVLTYQQWTLWEVPEDRRDLLRDWLDEVREMAERAANDNAPAPQAPPGAPPAPGPTPDSAPAAPPAQAA